MIEIECPWCMDSEDVALLSAQASEDFACETCGTVVHFTEDVTEELPLAA